MKDQENYTGLSANVIKLFKMHNDGEVKSTKGRRPFRLIYQEIVGSLQEARKREKYFKSGAGRRYLDKILSEHLK